MKAGKFTGRFFAGALAALTAIGSAAAAGASETALEPATVEAVAFQKASLTVVGPKGEATYTPSDLEKLGVYRTVTKTPWRDKAATFEGVRLVDLLKAHGLEDAAAVRVIAENDYAIVFPKEVWSEHETLIATRVDGRPHSRRARGPLQFVFSLEADPEMAAKSSEPYWVWMAARIEPIE